MGQVGTSLLECTNRGEDDEPQSCSAPLLPPRKQVAPRALEEGRGQRQAQDGDERRATSKGTKRKANAELTQKGRPASTAGAIREGIEEIVQEEKREVKEIKNKSWVFLRKLRWQLLGVVLYYAGGAVYYGHVCGWSFLDCMYFATAIVTTVGYGDIVPPQEDGPLLFTCGYILFAVLIIATTISTVLDEVMSGQLLEAMAALKAEQKSGIGSMLERAASPAGDDSPIFDGTQGKSGRDWKNCVHLARAIVWGVVFLGGGMVTYVVMEHKQSGDDGDLVEWSRWVRGMYFSITTLTTVGFGDVVPKTDELKVFDIIYMTVGIPVFGNFLATLMNFVSDGGSNSVQALVQVLELNHEKMQDLFRFEEEMHNACAGKLSGGKKGEIDCQEYMSFILVRNGVIDMDAIKDIVASFNRLDKDGSGVISVNDIALEPKKK